MSERCHSRKNFRNRTRDWRQLRRVLIITGKFMKSTNKADQPIIHLSTVAILKRIRLIKLLHPNRKRYTDRELRKSESTFWWDLIYFIVSHRALSDWQTHRGTYAFNCVEHFFVYSAIISYLPASSPAVVSFINWTVSTYLICYSGINRIEIDGLPSIERTHPRVYVTCWKKEQLSHVRFTFHYLPEWFHARGRYQVKDADLYYTVQQCT